MDFNTAQDLLIKNNHLIGQDMNGARINELILVPTNQNHADLFLRSYLRSLDFNEAIAPYAGSDVDVYVVANKSEINNIGVFFHTNIMNLGDEFNVVTE